MGQKKTQQECIAEFRDVHGGYYDYSRAEYLNSKEKVIVVCPLHGDFKITPNHHNRGVGCRKCYDVSQRTTKENFVIRARLHFGDRYDYSLFDQLPPFGEKVRILCRTHNEVFYQEPRNHIKGRTGCSKCKSLRLSGQRDARGTIKSDEELGAAFIKRAREIHGDIFDYSEFRYVNVSTKGKIVCLTHGEFWQSPGDHLRKSKWSKCPECIRIKRKEGTFSEKCETAGVNYYRALKRREAGFSEEEILQKGYARKSRRVGEITVSGRKYPNLEEAVRILKPPGKCATIRRWIKNGMPPEEAFDRIPNPGCADGIIYLIRHRASGKQYVGLTIQILDRRWKHHIEDAMAGSALTLHIALRKYGIDAFEICQIDKGRTKDDLEKKERYWIERLGTLIPHGFNTSTGGISGGSGRKPTEIDGKRFESRRKAIEYVAVTRGISQAAAQGRVQHNRIDVKTPAKPGQSLVRTQAYKTWSRIVHGVLNSKSKKEHIPGVELYARWRSFPDFFKDVGHPPRKGMVFARLDKTKGFFPNNCKWVEKSESSKITSEYIKRVAYERAGIQMHSAPTKK